MTTTRLQPQDYDAAIEMTETSRITAVTRNATMVPTDRDIEHEAIDSRPLLRTSDDDSDHEEDERFVGKEHEIPRRQSFWRIIYQRSWRVKAACFAFIAAMLIILPLYRKYHVQTESKNFKIGPYWHGFSKIEQYFAFGDSWTTTHFVVAGEQPSTKNPIGNPAFPGFTSSNGPNYVGYLTTQYNHSFIKAYDFAFGGSVIDAEVDRTLLEWLDFAHQLRDEFARYYVSNDTGISKPRGWDPETALFSTFFGINDVLVFDRKNPQLDKVFATYESLIGSLYDMGARNFLVMNIPPIDRSPLVTSRRAEDRVGFDSDVNKINSLIDDLGQHLRSRYKDITIFQMDVHDLFGRVMDNPQSTPQTACYANVTASCPAYNNHIEFGASPTKTQIDSCGGLGLDQFLWFDDLHVTWPVHDAIAAGIEKLLLSPGMH